VVELVETAEPPVVELVETPAPNLSNKE